jgi:hypothetical protein
MAFAASIMGWISINEKTTFSFHLDGSKFYGAVRYRISRRTHWLSQPSYRALQDETFRRLAMGRSQVIKDRDAFFERLLSLRDAGMTVVNRPNEHSQVNFGRQIA